jgi:hypothetical protein
MNFGFMHRTILEFDDPETFQLSPIARTEPLFEVNEVVDSFSRSDSFDSAD